jgi:hypothetical protein
VRSSSPDVKRSSAYGAHLCQTASACSVDDPGNAMMKAVTGADASNVCALATELGPSWPRRPPKSHHWLRPLRLVQYCLKPYPLSCRPICAALQRETLAKAVVSSKAGRACTPLEA